MSEIQTIKQGLRNLWRTDTLWLELGFGCQAFCTSLFSDYYIYDGSVMETLLFINFIIAIPQIYFVLNGNVQVRHYTNILTTLSSWSISYFIYLRHEAEGIAIMGYFALGLFCLIASIKTYTIILKMRYDRLKQ